MGAHALIALEPGDLRRAHMVFVDEGILGDVALPHRGPEPIVHDHAPSPNVDHYDVEL